jgi:uncharacterized protein (DUF302 family)
MKLILGIILGVILTIIVGWNMMPKLMLAEQVSPYNLTQTIDKIKANATTNDWVVPGVKELHKSIAKHGGGKIPPVILIELCQPHHAFNILQYDDNKKVSVFMPCTVAVYEKSDGKTYIGTLNAGLLGKMFGGVVAEVMQEVAKDQQNFIKFAK